MGNAKSHNQDASSSNVGKAPRTRRYAHRSATEVIESNRRWNASQGLQFHQNHGKNIEVRSSGKVADRVVGFCDAILFSSHPIEVMEKVTICLRNIDNGWSGALRIGFTSVDPSAMTLGIPRYACPDLTNRPGYWAKALSPNNCALNNKITFYVDMNGKLRYSVNNGGEIELLDGIDVNSRLWALFDLYGNTKSLEIISTDTFGIYPHSRSESSTRISLPADMISTAVNRLGLDTRPVPICFSATMGADLNCRNFKHVTRKQDSFENSCVVFTNTSLSAGQTAHFYCVDCRRQALRSLLNDMDFGVGITTCDPASITVSEMPQDASMLMDRPEYWVFHRDFENPTVGQYFSISVEMEGLITYECEGCPKTVLFYADVSEPLYLVLDLSGPVSSLAIVGMSRGSDSTDSRLRSVEDLASTINLLGNNSVINRITNIDNGELPSTSRYPHETDARDIPNPASRPEISTQAAGSTYPHEYVMCEPIRAPASQDSSSDDDFQEAVGHQAQLDTVAPIPGIQTDVVSGIEELRTSLNALWRDVMEEPPPDSLRFPAEKNHKTDSTACGSGKSLSQKNDHNEKTEKSPSHKETECVICCDVTANSVMYPCGHACLCFECGQVILGQRRSICPICRALVKDVIRIYQS